MTDIPLSLLTTLDSNFDEWDPNTWELDWPSYVYSTNSDHRAEVDFEDYAFVVRWLWRFKPSKGQSMLSNNGYLCRSAWVYPDGVKKNTSLYLHVEIMKRVEPPPSMFHTQVDHLDRNRLNCRRSNLRWSLPSDNQKNKQLPARAGGKWVKGTGL